MGLQVIIPYVGATLVTFPVLGVAFFQWGFSGDEFMYTLIDNNLSLGKNLANQLSNTALSFKQKKMSTGTRIRYTRALIIPTTDEAEKLNKSCP
jgi:hypothetical protein